MPRLSDIGDDAIETEPARRPSSIKPQPCYRTLRSIPPPRKRYRLDNTPAYVQSNLIESLIGHGIKHPNMGGHFVLRHGALRGTPAREERVRRSGEDAECSWLWVIGRGRDKGVVASGTEISESELRMAIDRTHLRKTIRSTPSVPLANSPTPSNRSFIPRESHKFFSQTACSTIHWYPPRKS